MALAEGRHAMEVAPELLISLLNECGPRREANLEEDSAQAAATEDAARALARRVHVMRRVLGLIAARHSKSDDARHVARMCRVLALRALADDDIADDDMKAEMQYGLEPQWRSEYSREIRELDALPVPCAGEIWIDPLGVVYDVLSVDDDSDDVEIKVLSMPDRFVDFAVLTTFAQPASPEQLKELEPRRAQLALVRMDESDE